MRFVAFLAIAAGLGGCAATGRPTRLALTIQGAAAGAAEQQRCRDAASHAGAILDAEAPLKAYVTLEPAGGRLQVLSPSRGLVRDEARPAGTVEPLCRDAAVAASGTPEAAPPTAGLPPGEDPARDQPTSPTTSGSTYHGPIGP